MTEQQFIKEVKKVTSKRVHKVTNSYTIYDIFLAYRKEYKHTKYKKELLPADTFYKVIRMFNKEIRELMLKGFTINLPHHMGDLSIRKYDTSAKIVNGELKVNYPINWKDTLQLWSTDEESHLKKTLLRSNVPEVYRVIYNKRNATYPNKLFYMFTVNREFKMLMKEKINSNELETFKKKKYEWSNG